MNIINKIKEKGILLSIEFILISTIYTIIKKIYRVYLNHNKIDNNTIVFMSNPDFSDNSKYLYQYLELSEKNYKFIWLIKKESKNKFNNSENTKYITINSKYHKGQTLKALYYMSKAKYLFFTHGSPIKEIKKKEEQLVINLWHGCGYKAVEKNEKTWIEDNYFDYALVPGKVFIETKSKFWGCSKEQILTIGYPRYDLLLKENKKTKDIVTTIKGNNKLVIWMPTFRKTEKGIFPEEKNNSNYDLPLLSSDKDIIELNEICKNNNTILCIKRHPYQIKYSCEKIELSNIIFIDNDYLNNNNIDLYSFLRYTDGLITDYSSVAIDYLLLDKPIGFTLDDFESYSKSRGFVFKNPKDYMPGYHIYNIDDLTKCIKDISEDKDIYKENRKEIIKLVHNKCNNYCERIVKKIKQLEDFQNEKNIKENKK